MKDTKKLNITFSKPVKQIFKINGFMLVIIDNSIVESMGIAELDLFQQIITDDGLLLKPINITEMR